MADLFRLWGRKADGTYHWVKMTGDGKKPHPDSIHRSSGAVLAVCGKSVDIQAHLSVQGHEIDPNRRCPKCWDRAAIVPVPTASPPEDREPEPVKAAPSRAEGEAALRRMAPLIRQLSAGFVNLTHAADALNAEWKDAMHHFGVEED